MASPDANPRFTVIIPTKDRASYLYHTLQTCSFQDYENLEIIVSDDGSADNTRDVTDDAARKDPRVRYVSPGRAVGMLENFEFALDQVKPGYVIALGGDDGLLPYGISRMRDVLVEKNQELLAWPAPMFFYAGARMPMAQMVIHIKHGLPYSGLRIVQSDQFLRRQADELSYVSDVEAPMFYVKGVTATTLVNRVRRRTPGGRFYACATPDGYSGIALAGEVQSYAFSGVPFSLHGVSPTSAGLGYLAHSEQARKQSEAFFASALKKPMHRDLCCQPYSPLISLMTADYLLTAGDLPGWPGLRPAIDYRRLLMKGLWELQDGLFAQDRVIRELTILDRIAKHHSLSDFFRSRVRHLRRNRRKPLEGNAISPQRLYINADQHGIRNVFDAAYFAYYVHAMPKVLTISNLSNALLNSARYRMLSLGNGPPFPPESEWISH